MSHSIIQCLIVGGDEAAAGVAESGARGRAARAGGGVRAGVGDDITAYDHEYVEQNHLAAALLLRVDERIGLTRPDFDALAEWAAAL